MILAVLAMTIALAVAYSTGGRISRLAAVDLHRVWALVAAVLAQMTVALLPMLGDPHEAVLQTLLIASLAGLLVFVLANRALPGMWLVAAGFALNAAVIIPNGAMPVSPDAIAYLGGEESIEPGKHRLLEPGDPLPWLADIIPVPGLRIIISVGDIVLGAGVGYTVYALMRRPIGKHAVEPAQR